MHVVELVVLRHVLSVSKYDEAVDSGQLALQLDHQINEDRVQHDQLVLCMIDDIL